MAPRIRRWLTAVFATLWFLGWAAACPAPERAVQAIPEAAAPPVRVDQSPLKVGVTTNMPPLIYRQGDRITGLEAELAVGLANHLGRPLQFMETDWQDQIPSLLEGRTDIIMSGMSITELRKLRIAFCNPYSRTGQMALVRLGDAERIKSGFYSLVQAPSVGAVADTTGASFVRSRFEKTQKQFFESPGEGAAALRKGAIDMLIHDAPVVLMLAAENESELEPVYRLLTEEYLAWGVRREDTALRKAADAYVDELKRNGRLRALVKRWMPFGD